MAAGLRRSSGATEMRLRALLLVAASVAGFTGPLSLVRGAEADLRGRLDAGAKMATLPLDLMLESLAAIALAACGLWLFVVTVAAAVEAVTGASSAALRAISPRLVRRLVLLSCGIAVGGAAVAGPATAADEHHRPGGPSPRRERAVTALVGLPMPDRAIGEAPAPWGAERGRPRPLLPRPGDRTYVVRRGDSLWSIAEQRLPGAGARRIDAAWRRIHRANRSQIGADPDLILPGTTLRLPDEVADIPRRHRKDPS